MAILLQYNAATSHTLTHLEASTQLKGVSVVVFRGRSYVCIDGCTVVGGRRGGGEGYGRRTPTDDNVFMTKSQHCANFNNLHLIQGILSSLNKDDLIRVRVLYSN